MQNNLGQVSEVEIWSTFSLSWPHYEYLVKWMLSHTKMQAFATLESLWIRAEGFTVVLSHTFFSPFPGLYSWSANMVWYVQLQEHGCNHTGEHSIFITEEFKYSPWMLQELSCACHPWVHAGPAVLRNKRLGSPPWSCFKGSHCSVITTYRVLLRKKIKRCQSPAHMEIQTCPCVTAL